MDDEGMKVGDHVKILASNSASVGSPPPPHIPQNCYKLFCKYNVYPVMNHDHYIVNPHFIGLTGGKPCPLFANVHYLECLIWSGMKQVITYRHTKKDILCTVNYIMIYST